MKPHNEKLREYADIWKITLLPTLIYFSDKSGTDLIHPVVQMLPIIT